MGKPVPHRRRIVILGAGFAGLTLATELDPLAASGSLDITLVERNTQFSMGFSMQWAMAGRRTFMEGQRPYASLRASHVQRLQEEVVAIDPANCTVHTRHQHLPYDDLVIALGAELAPELIPGLRENAHNLCDPDSVMQLKNVVSSCERGTILIMITSDRKSVV